MSFILLLYITHVHVLAQQLVYRMYIHITHIRVENFREAYGTKLSILFSTVHFPREWHQAYFVQLLNSLQLDYCQGST